MTSPIIRRATEADYPAIQEFLRSEWSPEHIFVKNPDLFKWQHLERDSGHLNYLLLELDEEIQSLIGYIPYRHWSRSAPENRVFLAIWKTSSHCKVAGAGFHLLRQVREIAKTDFIGAIGVSSIALPIYSRLGYKTGLMDHFAIFNSRPPSRFLLETPTQEISRGQVVFKELLFHSDSLHIDGICRSSGSAKNAEYFSARYGSHPVYTYQAYSLTLGESEVVLVTRVIELQGSLVCRVVDAVGDFKIIAKSAGALKALVEEQAYEYLDIYSTGLDVAAMLAGGFFARKPDSTYIIPNYFEPLVMMNSELAFAWKDFGSRKEAVLFRGDSDQDRPNYLARAEGQ